jgi:formylmethanofuran dehydrogenase subunit E
LLGNRACAIKFSRFANPPCSPCLRGEPYAATSRKRGLLKTLDENLRDAEIAHGHLCAGQVLGVRLAMRGLELLGIDDPHGKDRKRLITFVEIDRCATDAVGVVTGCRLGKRALKFRDWGKVAATFVDLESGRAVRVCAKESSKTLAREMHPEIENKNQQQMLAYREMSNEDLFAEQWVKVPLPPEELPGYKGERIVCAECGEGINFQREVRRAGKILCRACAGERYYEEIR